MPAVGSRAYVPPIGGEPSPYGLLGGCTEVVSADDMHQLLGTDLTAMSCGTVGQWQDCPTADSSPAGLWVNPVGGKTFDRPESLTFEPVTLFAGVECSTFGITQEEGQARALEQLRLGEQRALEDWFMKRWLSQAATGNDLTPVAGPLSYTAGVGVLENWLATTYGGLGVIHVPAGAAAGMSHSRIVNIPDSCQVEICSPRTLMGNCVVLGAGYAANIGATVPPATVGTVAPAGQGVIYITPPIRIRRDERMLTTTSEQQSIRAVTNDRFVLAESTFVIEVACPEAAMVRVDLSSCC
jgi:hypothetical protein